MKRLTFSIAALVLVLAMLGVGTLAFFSSTKSSTANTFTTGTLTLQLSNNGAEWAEGVTGTWTSPANWAPGESFTSIVWLKNNGSIGANMVYADWNNLVDPAGLAGFIEVTSIRDSYPWLNGAFGDEYIGNFKLRMGLAPDQPLTLAALVNWGNIKDVTAELNARTGPRPWEFGVSAGEVFGAPPDVLPGGSTLGLQWTFKLMDSTPDTMQNTWCTVDLKLMAAQEAIPAH